MRFFTTGETLSMLTPSMQDLKYAAADFLASSDFISRTIGMNNSYEDIMLFVQALGREPVSLLGKDYPFIFDHVRRNYQQGVTVPNMMHNDCPRFTFYKEKPTVRFADPYQDALNLLARWIPNISLPTTKDSDTNFFYAESSDGYDENRSVNVTSADTGTASGRKVRSFENLASCDLIKKTNDNFTRGLYNTLVARFHTNTQESKDPDNPTQTAISTTYGMSHGRNLLKLKPDDPNGYDNPYCRVWTYHHQYHRLYDAIRPFESSSTAEQLEANEKNGDDFLSFRTTESGKYEIKGGSSRLDKHGVLNYFNNLVNIAPTAKIKDYFYDKVDEKNKQAISIKKCMFSIENLAWRDAKKQGQKEFDEYGLSAEQRGPLGGRIMWFPPYDITFNEDVSVKWNSNEFIGRGENIYTYTNTERRGNLSFTLLIDHPSILDYWTGHEKNGMENRGEPLLPGDTDGVDGKNNQEQTLLRFFAGCDILTARQQTYLKGGKKAPVEEEKKNPNDNPGETTEASKTSEESICCILYFPNNYSGVDDGYRRAIDYLMNGIGTQKHIDKDGKVQDMYISMNERYTIKGTETKYGGYELITPISVAKKADVLKTKNACKKTYYDYDKGGEESQYITNADGSTVYETEDGYMLAKMVCDKPNGKFCDGLKNTYYGKESLKSSNWSSKNWNTLKWYYRVDKNHSNERLEHSESYIDYNCEHLNGSGYEKVSTTQLKKKINLPKGGKLIPFSALFYALDSHEFMDGYESLYGVKTEGGGDVDIINKLKEESSGIKITEVLFRGHASKPGYQKCNEVLAKNRATILHDWFKSKFPSERLKDVKEFKVLNEIIEADGNNANLGGANDVGQKIWRSASVTIKYTRSNVEDASRQETKQGDQTTVVKDDKSNQYNVIYENFKKSPQFGSWKENEENKHRVGKGGLSDKQLFDIWVKQMEGFSNALATETKKEEEKPSVVKRYDNEGEFFELLDKQSPFLHHLITDKIKYFDPAYHSISPEGFNARLTFLHQCTRQGATIGNSDMNVKTAYNLAFGRPPVCVLRVGDFYYTKIIINSMQLNYDSPQWDLNPEGIGVMPMFAKVSINFTFIGGSDLAGPIARLQNAVSFNYYANTGVYDNRAEAVEYDENGSGKETKYKPFNYPNSSE